ncbi:uncharacterized protein LOC113833187 isoform X2 [Cricetulus griseus]|uniref:Uncharacterized protein LOC113833187 isoform X2 n=1 Tax=Cricetulus griseus TaxID=10029 RepID=A0A9J7KCX5_CRIGR|nr:uncharacterized protein LOC113833187 isoform X2 [Cricetulus griseus]
MGAGPRRGEPDGAEARGETGRLGPSDAGYGAPSGGSGLDLLRGGRERPARPAGNTRAAAGRPASRPSPEFVTGPGGSPSLRTAFLTTRRSPCPCRVNGGGKKKGGQSTWPHLFSH